RQAVKDIPGSEVMGALAERAVLDQVMSILLWIVTGLLGVALLIAIVGIGNTLSLSVLERTRESGVQRALGMTRRQLRGSLALEALLLAGVGTTIGVVLGIAFGWLGTRTLLAGVTESFPLVVPVPRLLMICAVAAVAGVLASVLPSRKAARIPPTQALATE
ncbi:MAG: putative transport system permease protein, partial [Actinomycetota bacterium]|nr:putative transport system permease protein [Actinomycetota bacterium]